MSLFNDGFGNLIHSNHPWNDWWIQSWPTLELDTPKVDFRHEIEMAGTKKSSISLKFKSGQFTVTWTTRLGQLRYFTYSLGEKYYETDKLSATYEDGLLTIHCPLKQVIPPPTPPPEPEIDIEIK